MTAPAGEQVSVYEAAGGAPAMLALAHAWHQRCLADPEAQHPFSHPGLHPRHTERLAAYWGEMLGGPDAYSRELASVAHLVRIHSGNGPHPELDAGRDRVFAAMLGLLGILAGRTDAAAIGSMRPSPRRPRAGDGGVRDLHPRRGEGSPSASNPRSAFQLP